MTADVQAGNRRALAFAILTKIPRFAIWAESVREFATPYGTIGYRQAAILWVIRYELLPPQEMTPTGFATFHRIQPSVVTRSLAKLVHGGFIQRTIDTADTRVSRISITEQGDAISRYIEQLYIDDLLAAIDQIPDERLDDLAESIAVLDQIADTLEQRRLNRTRRGKAVPAAD